LLRFSRGWAEEFIKQEETAGAAEFLFNPRTSAWNEHFSWSNDFTAVVGKTACGRATI
jgi:hypothetical protein